MIRLVFWSSIGLAWALYFYALIFWASPEQRRQVGSFVLVALQALLSALNQ